MVQTVANHGLLIKLPGPTGAPTNFEICYYFYRIVSEKKISSIELLSVLTTLLGILESIPAYCYPFLFVICSCEFLSSLLTGYTSMVCAYQSQ